MGDENFMATFITGLVILLLGGWLYGKFVEHVFKPDLSLIHISFTPQAEKSQLRFIMPEERQAVP